MGLDLEDWVGSDSLEMGADGRREFWASGVVCSGWDSPGHALGTASGHDRVEVGGSTGREDWESVWRSYNQA